jgi:hypothetical protein
MQVRRTLGGKRIGCARTCSAARRVGPLPRPAPRATPTPPFDPALGRAVCAQTSWGAAWRSMVYTFLRGVRSAANALACGFSSKNPAKFDQPMTPKRSDPPSRICAEHAGSDEQPLPGPSCRRSLAAAPSRQRNPQPSGSRCLPLARSRVRQVPPSLQSISKLRCATRLKGRTRTAANADLPHRRAPAIPQLSSLLEDSQTQGRRRLTAEDQHV